MNGHDIGARGSGVESPLPAPVIRRAHYEGDHGIFAKPEPIILRAGVALAAVTSLAIPVGTLDDADVSLMWFTVAVTLALAAYAIVRTRLARGNPWIAPVALLLGFYFLKYGIGLALLYYWQDIPFTDFSNLAAATDVVPIHLNLGTTCHIILIGACGMYLGASQPLTLLSALLPALRWPIDRARFNQNLMIYTPIAILLVAWLYYYLPVTIRDTVILFGWIVFVLIVIASYEFFSSSVLAGVRWFIAILLMYGAVFSIFLYTGMREHALKPAMMVMIGYVLRRQGLPLRIIAPLLPVLVFLVLPWLSLYKSVDVGDAGVAEKIAATNRQLESVPWRGRIELATAGTVARVLVGGPAFVSIYSYFYPTQYPHEMGRSMIDEVLGLVPRVVWPDKPNLSAQLSVYTRKIGILPEVEFDASSTMVTFDAISEYYVNFGLVGVLLLSIAHGMYVRLLYEWLVGRSVFTIGAACYAVVILLNHDFVGVVQMFLAHTRQLLVWPLMLYVLSRRSE